MNRIIYSPPWRFAMLLFLILGMIPCVHGTDDYGMNDYDEAEDLREGILYAQSQIRKGVPDETIIKHLQETHPTVEEIVRQMKDPTFKLATLLDNKEESAARKEVLKKFDLLGGNHDFSTKLFKDDLVEIYGVEKHDELNGKHGKFKRYVMGKTCRLAYTPPGVSSNGIRGCKIIFEDQKCPTCDGEGIINANSINFEKLRKARSCYTCGEYELNPDREQCTVKECGGELRAWTLDSRGRSAIDKLLKKLLCRVCKGTSKPATADHGPSFKVTLHPKNVRIPPTTVRPAHARPPQTDSADDFSPDPDQVV